MKENFREYIRELRSMSQVSIFMEYLDANTKLTIYYLFITTENERAKHRNMTIAICSFYL
jgi:hypothetical protein